MNRVAESSSVGAELVSLALNHSCARHPFFDRLKQCELTAHSAGSLLRNYDAHACVLRRFLLKAASMMPEEAVGYILENVRTEFGAGDISSRHQLQLLDLALKSGVSLDQFKVFHVQSGIKKFIKDATKFYNPSEIPLSSRMVSLYKPAIIAGAITATEILALEEFKALQLAFASLSLEHHIWFDHVQVEAEHSGASVELAAYFLVSEKNIESVLYGFNGVLNANVSLYDGLLAALNYRN
jgi:hypothetical protein